jgi:signal transduction histidine kinase/putative methionine-R-sulfoxide reductase with GAF domain
MEPGTDFPFIPAPLEALAPVLLRPSDQLVQAVFDGDRQAVFGLLAADCCRALSAEGCGLFALAEDAPDCLRWEAGHPAAWAAACKPLRRSVQHFQQGGWLGEAAHRRQAVCLGRGELAGHAGLAGRKADGLAAGGLHSILALPLLGRKGTSFHGVLEFVNKQGGPEAAFTAEDVTRAGLLARVLGAGLDLLHAIATAHRHLPRLNNARSLDEIYQVILWAAVQLFRADRGDLALWDRAADRLVLRTTVGAAGRLKPGDAVPERSVTFRAWSSGQPRVVAEAQQEADYFCLDPAVRSEMVLPWELDGTPTGILTIASYRPNHFDLLDLALLKVLRRCGSFAFRVFGHHVLLDNIYLGLVQAPAPGTEALRTVLESAADIYRFDAGLIYLVDRDGSRLYCAEAIGCASGGFSYQLTDRALATEVYRRREPIYVPDPQASDVVNHEGIRKFNIRGGLLGMPLLFRGQAVGVLVVWHKTRPDFIREHHKRDLEPFARVAAATIALGEVARGRDRAQREYQHLQRQMQTALSFEAVVKLILEAVQKIGFDRAWIFDFREATQSFECRACVGVTPDVRGQAVPLAGNRYARHTWETGPADPRARVYDPAGAAGFGPDPDAAALGRAPHARWATVPLVVQGRVCGQLVAAHADPGREIAPEILDYLTHLGALASQAVANERALFEVQCTQALPVLFDTLAVEGPTEAVVRQLLVYATAGEGLRFSRALFFKAKAGSARLDFMAGVGSVTAARHEHVTRVALGKGMRRLLAEAKDMDDRELEGAVKDVSLEARDPVVAQLLGGPGCQEFFSRRRADWPAWLRDLARRTSGAEYEHSEFLAVRVGDEHEPLGVLLVDRLWQGRDLTLADARALVTFARLAALILRQHRLYRHVLETRDLTLLGFITGGLTHDLFQPLSALEAETGNLQEDVRAGRFDEAAECAGRMAGVVGELVKRVRGLRTFFQPEAGPVNTDVRVVMADALYACRQRRKAVRIEYRVSVADDVRRVPLLGGLLRTALINLITNAEQALERARRDGFIEVGARHQDGGLAVAVSDNGPGMKKEDRERVRQRGSVFTSDPSKGLGIGLQIVHRAAEAHQTADGSRRGRLTIDSEEGKGACFTVWIPVERGGGQGGEDPAGR